MTDALGRIIASLFFVLAICYFLITAQAMAQENMSQTYLTAAVVEFVDNARSSGKITTSSYEDFCLKVDTVVPLANIEIIHQTAYAAPDGAGNIDTCYYSIVKDEILPALYSGNGRYDMHNGDFLKVTVYNAEPTLAEKLMRLFSTGSGRSTASLYVTYSGGIGNCPQ